MPVLDNSIVRLAYREDVAGNNVHKELRKIIAMQDL